ncbi:hypothetical protein JN00_0495 [Metamycoplasma subdolum]|uniref:Cell division protein FtsA n=1 Tax=Metamycoplasma subdolum TaxID=92407 RepID=A0A3M0A4Y7_9BACT|nr:hypothetical protein [Metamycoplasma subdolum]RMA77535.1 hypothetical protein JN00_0495 [Metamycoplasma subdolum]WPB50727.1 hypothetical protein R9C05_01090 [Metamycoplasma subdolum]
MLKTVVTVLKVEDRKITIEACEKHDFRVFKIFEKSDSFTSFVDLRTKRFILDSIKELEKKVEAKIKDIFILVSSSTNTLKVETLSYKMPLKNEAYEAYEAQNDLNNLLNESLEKLEQKLIKKQIISTRIEDNNLIQNLSLVTLEKTFFDDLVKTLKEVKVNIAQIRLLDDFKISKVNEKSAISFIKLDNFKLTFSLFANKNLIKVETIDLGLNNLIEQISETFDLSFKMSWNLLNLYFTQNESFASNVLVNKFQFETLVKKFFENVEQKYLALIYKNQLTNLAIKPYLVGEKNLTFSFKKLVSSFNEFNVLSNSKSYLVSDEINALVEELSQNVVKKDEQTLTLESFQIASKLILQTKRIKHKKLALFL